MSLLSSAVPVDAREVAKRIKSWLDARHFETMALSAGSDFVVRARKASGLRAMVGADRALEVAVRSTPTATEVDVRQGSWKTNAISNAAWLVATGGTNLLISGWSVVIQKDLENYVKQVFDELSGAKPVEL